jgi:hypothetical protein
MKKTIGIFGKSDETASDARKEYNSRINGFLSELEGPSLNPFQRRDDPLGELLSWSTHAMEKLEKYRHYLVLARAEIKDLHGRLEEAQDRVMILKHERESLIHKIKEGEQIHSEDMQMLTIQHEQQVNEMDSKFNRIALRMKDDKSKLISEHSQEKDKLITQLFASHSNTKEWPDEKLKLKYRELQMMIESLVLLKEFRLQPGQTLSPQWDTSNFMGTIKGRGLSHFLLRSVIWKIIIDHYFAAPFGFGALGSGKGKQELSRCYVAWLQLVKGEQSSGQFIYPELNVPMLTQV